MKRYIIPLIVVLCLFFEHSADARQVINYASRPATSAATCDDPGDIHATNTQLLLHSNNPDGSQRITDSGPQKVPVSFEGTSGHETDLSAAIEFGNSAMYVSSSSGSGVKTETDCSFGSGNFYVSTYYTPVDDTPAGDYPILSCGGGSSGWGGEGVEWDLYIATDGSIYWAYWNGSAPVTALDTVSDVTTANTQVFIELFQSGGNVYLYLDEVQKDSDTAVTITSEQTTPYLMLGNGQQLGTVYSAAYFDEVIIDKGGASYSSGAPTEPYSSTCYPLDGYQYQADINIDESTDNNFSAAITDGVVPVKITDSGFTTWFCGSHDVNDLAYNVAFTDGDDEYTQKYFEFAYADCNAGTPYATYYVRENETDGIAAASDTNWKVYYGGYSPNVAWGGSVNFNETVSCETWDGLANTTDGGAIYHMVGAAYTDIDDSSCNSNDVTSQNGTPDLAQTGTFDQSVTFLGPGDEGLSINDSNSLSFGDASNDSPFSIFTLSMGTALTATIDEARFFSKGTSSEREYMFYTDLSADLVFMTLDTSTLQFERITSDASMGAYDDAWATYAATYDGTGGASANTGMTLYVEGSSEASTGDDAGTYVAMHNTVQKASLGWNAETWGGETKIDELYLASKELSSSEIALYHHGLKGTLLDYTAPTVTATPLFQKVSDGSYLNYQFETLTGFTDADGVNGVSTQAEHEEFAVFHFDTNTAATSNLAYRYNTALDGTDYPNSTACVTMRFYLEDIGTKAATDYFAPIVSFTSYDFLGLAIASDGLWLRNNSNVDVEVSGDPNLVCSGSSAEGCWQTWTFDCSGINDSTPSTPSCDIYRMVPDNGETRMVRVASSVEMGHKSDGSSDEGRYGALQLGYATADQLSNIEYLMISETCLNE